MSNTAVMYITGDEKKSKEISYRIKNKKKSLTPN